MRRTRWLAIALLALVGCQSTENKQLKPPLHEEYNLPPDDSRYSSPIAYPKDVLNQPPARSSSPQGPGAAPKGPQRIGSGSGMSGY
jgi:hypothetical protein